MWKSKTAGTQCLIVLGRPAETDENEDFIRYRILLRSAKITLSAALPIVNFNLGGVL
jgi:hypothetical protein